MFYARSRQENKALQARLVRVDQEIAVLRGDLSRLEDERDAVRAELEGIQVERQTTTQLYANMQGFGDSFVELQKSQAVAAQTLREEKEHAIEAAVVSASSREAVSQIVQSLDALSGDTIQTSQDVQNLTGRTAKATSEISTIVVAIQGETDRTRTQMEGRAEKSQVFSKDVCNVMDNMKHLLELSHQMEARSQQRRCAILSKSPRSIIFSINSKSARCSWAFRIARRTASLPTPNAGWINGTFPAMARNASPNWMAMPKSTFRTRPSISMQEKPSRHFILATPCAASNWPGRWTPAWKCSPRWNELRWLVRKITACCVNLQMKNERRAYP